jgi:glycosyl transferase family 87
MRRSWQPTRTLPRISTIRTGVPASPGMAGVTGWALYHRRVTDPVSGASGRVAVRRGMAVVLASSVVAAVCKLVIAATTLGSDDVQWFTLFARAVHRVGPINVYAQHFGLPYNHPPLVSWWLVLNNWLTGHTPLTLPFLIRLPATLADVVSAWLIFTILRRRRPLSEATAAGVLVGCSPVLVIISGFHGNTDPVFVMFCLLSAWLLADRGRPGWSGVCFAAALSVKIVPIVILPALLITAARRRSLGSFVMGAAVVIVPLWLPVLIRQWHPFLHNVIGYSGTERVKGPWGLVNLAWSSGHLSLARSLVFHGKLLPVLLSAALAALVVTRADKNLPAAVGMAFGAFVAFSPVFATQYLAWPVAGLYLVDFFSATAYNLSCGLFLFLIYNRWNHGLPWDRAVSAGVIPAQRDVGIVAWICLLLALTIGCARMIMRMPMRATTTRPATR